jgi:D-3-phosphoglycerate dehydrogenase
VKAAPRTLTVDVAGDIAAFDSTPLVAATLRGLLGAATTERINLVNAAAVAKARGITVVQRRSPSAGAYAGVLTLTAEGGGGPATVAGTVAAGEPRLVRLDDYRLDMEPTDVMLITRHRDRPGMIGRIGTLLGEADVNISAMHVARSSPRADAFMILALDEDPPASVTDTIRATEAIIDLWTIRLTGDR